MDASGDPDPNPPRMTPNNETSIGGKGKQVSEDEGIIPGGRGKGKEKEEANDSLIDRLQSSTRMAFDAVTTSKNIPSLSPADKVTGATNSTGRVSSGLEEASWRAASSSRPGQGVGESMRTVPHSDESAQAFNQFFNDPQSPLVVEQDHLQPSATWQSVDGSIAEQEASDGSAVLQLLSRPDGDDELEDQSFLTDAELSPAAAGTLREALFDSADTRAIAWNDLLNFMPDFLARPEDHAEAAREVELQMGVSDVGAAQSLWLQQWDVVLSAYSDEVWGDLSSLAARAREEVNQLSASASVEGTGRDSDKTKALERLRLILAHVRGQ